MFHAAAFPFVGDLRELWSPSRYVPLGRISAPASVSYTEREFSTPASSDAAANVAAIQAVLDLGGRIVFTRGDDYFIDANLEIPDNTILDLGTATITGKPGSGDRRLITNSGSSNITLRNGTVRTLNTNSTSRLVTFDGVAGVEIDDVTLFDAEVHSVEIIDCTDIWVHHCTITGYGDDAITMHTSLDMLIEWNLISGGRCLKGGSHGVEIEDANGRITVRYNTISDNLNNADFPAFQAGGVLITANNSDPQVESSSVIVEYNSITNCQFSGIRSFSDVSNPHLHVHIRRNTVTGCGSSATGVISLINTRFASLSDNVVSGDFSANAYGYYIENCYDWRMLRNSVAGVGRQGVYVDATTGARGSIARTYVDSVGVGLSSTDAIKIVATSANNAELEIVSNTIRNTQSVSNMTKGVNIGTILDYWTLIDNDVDIGGTAANAYIYTAPAHSTVSNNLGGEAGDL